MSHFVVVFVCLFMCWLCFCVRQQPLGPLPIHSGPGPVGAGPGVQPETVGAEGAAAAAAPRPPTGTILQRKVPQARTHQAGTRVGITHKEFPVCLNTLLKTFVRGINCKILQKI